MKASSTRSKLIPPEPKSWVKAKVTRPSVAAKEATTVTIR
jgi:hypothetical protein